MQNKTLSAEFNFYGGIFCTADRSRDPVIKVANNFFGNGIIKFSVRHGLGVPTNDGRTVKDGKLDRIGRELHHGCEVVS